MTHPPNLTAKAPPLRDAGAMFVESIIAAAIVTMALGTLFQVVMDSANRDRAIESRRTALLIAQSELADVGSEIPLQAGQSAGFSGNMAWRVEITPYSDGVDSSGAGELWRVAISVRPRNGGADIANLTTLRLSPKA